MPALTARDRRPEIMDQPGLAESRHTAALRGLRRINRISRTAASIAQAISHTFARAQNTPLRILDLASGGGDVAIGLAHWARRRGLPWSIHGVDVSPTAVDFAQVAAAREQLDQVTFSCLDVLAEPLPEDYDVVMCSLFLHHLDDADVPALQSRMATAARRGVLIDDLLRSRLGYTLAWLGCRLLTRSPVVHADGPQSVEAAFTVSEAIEMAERAGLTGARVTRHWPERFLLTWSKS